MTQDEVKEKFLQKLYEAARTWEFSEDVLFHEAQGETSIFRTIVLTKTRITRKPCAEFYLAVRERGGSASLPGDMVHRFILRGHDDQNITEILSERRLAKLSEKRELFLKG